MSQQSDEDASFPLSVYGLDGVWIKESFLSPVDLQELGESTLENRRNDISPPNQADSPTLRG